MSKGQEGKSGPWAGDPAQSLTEHLTFLRPWDPWGPDSLGCSPSSLGPISPSTPWPAYSGTSSHLVRRLPEEPSKVMVKFPAGAWPGQR